MDPGPAISGPCMRPLRAPECRDISASIWIPDRRPASKSDQTDDLPGATDSRRPRNFGVSVRCGSVAQISGRGMVGGQRFRLQKGARTRCSSKRCRKSRFASLVSALSTECSARLSAGWHTSRASPWLECGWYRQAISATRVTSGRRAPIRRPAFTSPRVRVLRSRVRAGLGLMDGSAAFPLDT